MKKFLSLVTVIALAITVSACGGNSTTDCKTNVILVTDQSGVNDKSFNQGANEGLIKWADEFKDQGACNVPSIQANTEADYVPTLESVSGKDNALIVTAGFTFEEPVTEVAKKNPNQHYLIIDTTIKAKNVVSADFAANEGSFLVGVAAAEKAKEANASKVGFIGGMESPTITGFEVGYIQGVHAIDPNMKVDVQYIGSFTDSAKGKTIAEQMYSNGDYVIFVAAGQAGNGVIDSAKEKVKDQGKDVWVIGVDRDQYEDGIYEGDKSVILTSMVKRADVATYDVAKLEMEGKFPANQTLKYDLSDGGVGIPDKNPNLDETILKKIDEYKTKIINGEIKVANTK
ncbi:MAG: BMP family ABC transporter substrate-binding protein [Bacilli bacterium]|jgi:basic membrane protein A|nr:BMP family ABC transporter substrate-binding protein [Bacilli bacterium]